MASTADEEAPDLDRRSFAALGVAAAAAVAALGAPAAHAQQSGGRGTVGYGGPMRVYAGGTLRLSLFNFGEHPVSGTAFVLDAVTGATLTEVPIPSLAQRKGFGEDVPCDEDGYVVVAIRLAGNTDGVVATWGARTADGVLVSSDKDLILK